ncbi:MAG: OmpA family protein [Rhodobacteraceae bacterium]|nr:OmpA family protein [Paracoccaceae bacterium]
MRPIAIIFAVVALLAGISLSWVIAAKTITWLEEGRQAEMEQAFYAGGIEWANAEADGFLLTLSGEAPTGEDQERALKIGRLIFAENLQDATTTRQPTISRPPDRPPFLEILKNGNDLSFIGTLPEGESQQVLAKYIAALGAETRVTDVSVTTGSAPPSWLPAFEYALRIASLTHQSIINVSPGAVVLEAVPLSASWQPGFEEMAAKLRPEGVSFTVDIATARQIISPYVFSLDIAAPEVATCTAQDEAVAARIYSSVEQIIGTPITCDIGIGAPSRQWFEAVKAGLAALSTLGGGRLDIIDADMTLTAPETVSAEDFERAVQVLGFALPGGFTLQASRDEPSPDVAIEESRPIAFTATLSDEGQVQIEGSVKNALTREVVMRFSEAKFGYGLVEDRLWLEENLPDGWQVRVFALIEALALLNEGKAEMTPATLEISGDASFENPAIELKKTLLAAYGPEQPRLDITYTAPPAGSEGPGLDPRLCVSRITSLLAGNGIAFAPSSAVISDPSLPTIAAIADILTQCRTARIEIGGHTDSQGREVMNRTLSQSRADAVLDAVLARNLLLGDITAKGYGEAEPIADNGTEAGRTRNRRIEFKLLRAPSNHPPEAQATPRIRIDNFSRPAMRAPASLLPAPISESENQ